MSDHIIRYAQIFRKDHSCPNRALPCTSRDMISFLIFRDNYDVMLWHNIVLVQLSLAKVTNSVSDVF